MKRQPRAANADGTPVVRTTLSTLPPKVLVVDDSLTILTFVASLLGQAECEVRTCNSIWISADVAEFQPDLVLMDVNLGASKGTNAVTALRGRSISSGTRIVLHSSLPEDELQQLAEECGADGYIRKTQDPEALLRQVSTFLPHHQPLLTAVS